MTATDLVTKLEMKPHPEGGYYKETYRSEINVPVDGGKERSASTAIYYLLENDNKSHFHRIRSDEMWFYHMGETLEVVCIENGEVKKILLGNDLANGETPQAMVPAGTWFGSRLKNGKGFALVSCTVAPGFDFEDFEVANRNALTAEYPHLAEIIRNLTQEQVP